MNKRQAKKRKNQKIRERIAYYEWARNEHLRDGYKTLAITCEHYIEALREALRM